jgi:hypothetical protein
VALAQRLLGLSVREIADLVTRGVLEAPAPENLPAAANEPSSTGVYDALPRQLAVLEPC